MEKKTIAIIIWAATCCVLVFLVDAITWWWFAALLGTGNVIISFIIPDPTPPSRRHGHSKCSPSIDCGLGKKPKAEHSSHISCTNCDKEECCIPKTCDKDWKVNEEMQTCPVGQKNTELECTDDITDSANLCNSTNCCRDITCEHDYGNCNDVNNLATRRPGDIKCTGPNCTYSECCYDPTSYCSLENTDTGTIDITGDITPEDNRLLITNIIGRNPATIDYLNTNINCNDGFTYGHCEPNDDSIDKESCNIHDNHEYNCNQQVDSCSWSVDTKPRFDLDCNGGRLNIESCSNQCTAPFDDVNLFTTENNLLPKFKNNDGDNILEHNGLIPISEGYSDPCNQNFSSGLFDVGCTGGGSLYTIDQDACTSITCGRAAIDQGLQCLPGKVRNYGNDAVELSHEGDDIHANFYQTCCIDRNCNNSKEVIDTSSVNKNEPVVCSMDKMLDGDNPSCEDTTDCQKTCCVVKTCAQWRTESDDTGTGTLNQCNENWTDKPGGELTPAQNVPVDLHAVPLPEQSYPMISGNDQLHDTVCCIAPKCSDWADAEIEAGRASSTEDVCPDRQELRTEAGYKGWSQERCCMAQRQECKRLGPASEIKAIHGGTDTIQIQGEPDEYSTFIIVGNNLEIDPGPNGDALRRQVSCTDSSKSPVFECHYDEHAGAGADYFWHVTGCGDSGEDNLLCKIPQGNHITNRYSIALAEVQTNNYVSTDAINVSTSGDSILTQSCVNNDNLVPNVEPCTSQFGEISISGCNYQLYAGENDKYWPGVTGEGGSEATTAINCNIENQASGTLVHCTNEHDGSFKRPDLQPEGLRDQLCAEGNYLNSHGDIDQCVPCTRPSGSEHDLFHYVSNECGHGNHNYTETQCDQTDIQKYNSSINARAAGGDTHDLVVHAECAPPLAPSPYGRIIIPLSTPENEAQANANIETISSYESGLSSICAPAAYTSSGYGIVRSSTDYNEATCEECDNDALNQNDDGIISGITSEQKIKNLLQDVNLKYDCYTKAPASEAEGGELINNLYLGSTTSLSDYYKYQNHNIQHIFTHEGLPCSSPGANCCIDNYKYVDEGVLLTGSDGGQTTKAVNKCFPETLLLQSNCADVSNDSDKCKKSVMWDNGNIKLCCPEVEGSDILLTADEVKARATDIRITSELKNTVSGGAGWASPVDFDVGQSLDGGDGNSISWLKDDAAPRPDLEGIKIKDEQKYRYIDNCEYTEYTPRGDPARLELYDKVGCRHLTRGGELCSLWPNFPRGNKAYYSGSFGGLPHGSQMSGECAGGGSEQCAGGYFICGGEDDGTIGPPGDTELQLPAPASAIARQRDAGGNYVPHHGLATSVVDYDRWGAGVEGNNMLGNRRDLLSLPPDDSSLSVDDIKLREWAEDHGFPSRINKTGKRGAGGEAAAAAWDEAVGAEDLNTNADLTFQDEWVYLPGTSRGGYYNDSIHAAAVLSFPEAGPASRGCINDIAENECIKHCLMKDGCDMVYIAPHGSTRSAATGGYDGGTRCCFKHHNNRNKWQEQTVTNSEWNKHLTDSDNLWVDDGTTQWGAMNTKYIMMNKVT